MRLEFANLEHKGATIFALFAEVMTSWRNFEMNTKHLVLALGLVFAACTPSKSPDSQNEQTEKAKSQIVKGERIEILHRYIKAPQRNTLYEIEHFDDGHYASRDGVTIEGKLVDALVAAAQVKLISSDGFYSCRPDEARPEFVVKFTHQKKQYEAISSSHCLDEAPWNIVVDNEAFVQMSGDFGRALRDVLQSLSAEKWSETYKAGVIDIEAQGPLSQAKIAQIPLKDTLIAPLLQKSDIQAITGEDKIKATKLGCDQEKSPDCSELLGYLDIELSPQILYRLDFQRKADSWEYAIAQDLDAASRLAQSKIAQALQSTDPDGFTLQRESSEDCATQRALLPHFKKDAQPSTGECVRWAMNPKLVQNKLSLPPTLVYYPELDAVWIAFSPEVNSDAIFNSYFGAKSTEKYADPSVSVFVQLESGKGVAFQSTEDNAKKLPDSFFKK